MLETIFEFVNNFQIIYLVKLLLLVIGLFYFVFSLIVYQQINLMSQVIETTASWSVKFLGLVFILLGVAFFALVLLLA